MQMTSPGGMPRTAADTPYSAPLLRLIFDHAGEGISVFDASLRLTAWNQRFLDFSGVVPGQVMPGAALEDLLLGMAQTGEFGPCEPHAEVASRLAMLGDGRPSVTQRVRPDGRTIELRRSPTPGGGFVMLYVDISGRVAAESALADKQRLLSLLQQHTEQGFWFIDNNLRTTDANPAMCRMLGLTLAEMIGRDIYSFVDDANAAVFRHHVAERAQGRAEGYEIELTRADGSKVQCYNNATPIIDAAGRKLGAVGLFSDISPLKQAEQQVRHTSELLAQKSHMLEVALDNLSQGVLSIDAAGRTNTWNRRFLELLEIPASLMQTLPTLHTLTQFQVAQGHFGEDLGRMEPDGREGLNRYLAGDSRLLAPRYQRVRRDGTVLDVQTHRADDGSVVRTYTDVTSGVRAQQALRSSEARFRTMADGAPALIWQSAADGTPIWFNQRWLQYTGRTMAAELACTWAQRLHPDDHERWCTTHGDAALRRVAYDIEFRLRRADGGYGWIADSGIPHAAPGGEFDGYIGYGWEITERKAAEVALIAAKEEAERANRAKSDFLSRMSHELRTPLNAVLGFGQLMQADATDPLSPRQRDRVHDLLRGGRHLLSLINDVLDLARIEAGTLHLQLAPVDLAELARDSLQLVQPMAAERGITLGLQLAAGGPAQVLADATRLKQVLLNLLSNAIKYNHDGGSVQVALVAEPGGDTVRLEVRDSGPGLSASQQERLFQAFERLDADRSSVEGTGIGLALSKWLVDLMNGQIGVQSAPGEGSCFWVRLAGCDAQRPSPPPETALAAKLQPMLPSLPPALPLQARQTVLYIEDNEVNQILMEGMLAQRPRIRLVVAGLPEEGLVLATQLRPDLILLDIQLPGMSGFEVLAELRALPATRHIPVVAVSANAMQSDIDDAAQAGFVDYVTKPLDLMRLLSVVDGLLDRPAS
jgi:PAS domain S-box-containing protein